MKQQILTAISNVAVINKRASKISKIWKFFILQVTFFSSKFVGIVFAGTVFVIVLFVVSIILLHVTTESSIMLFAYLPLLQPHVAGF